jgi:[acyl-carrier-protein] S-malonyltransferase
MEPTAYIFPGQGSQYVGMARALSAGNPEAQALLKEADRLLAFPLSRICFEGPDEELRQTRNTQPAIFLHSILAARALRQSPPPAMVAGHSLGEYSALVVAGALSFEDGLRLVSLRGQLMQQAGEERRGTMAAIVGLGSDQLEALCREASQAGIVQPANYNSPGQTVISGSLEGVHRAMELARERGAKLVKELVVSGAFHSPLMESAREGLTQALKATTIHDARIPLYANVTAEPVTAAETIRELLIRQLTAPVLWEQSIRNMVRDGATTFVELGPGKVLQNLVKRIHPASSVRGVDGPGDLPGEES